MHSAVGRRSRGSTNVFILQVAVAGKFPILISLYNMIQDLYGYRYSGIRYLPESPIGFKGYRTVQGRAVQRVPLGPAIGLKRP